jgi:hypothetical protein
MSRSLIHSNSRWFLCFAGFVGLAIAGFACAADTASKAVIKPRPPLACLHPLAASDTPPGDARASARLAEGIALFDQGRLVPAYHGIKTALSLGLPDPLEVAIANKYLAFYYCTTKARALCEKRFEMALLASPGFDLTPSEKQTATWANAYETVYRRLTVDCTVAHVAGPSDRSGIFLDEPPSGIRATSNASDAQSPAPTVLRFAVRPWGDVYLNGKRWVTTPPVKEVQLAPGRHRIEIRNGKLRPFAQEFVFAPGAQLLLRHDF